MGKSDYEARPRNLCEGSGIAGRARDSCHNLRCLETSQQKDWERKQCMCPFARRIGLEPRTWKFGSVIVEGRRDHGLISNNEGSTETRSFF